MQYVRAADGVALGHVVATDGARGADTPPVVLVHGWMATADVWDDLLPSLRARRVVVPSMRGTPASPAPAASITLERLAEDLVALLVSLDVPAHVVGHSMGAQVAAWAAGLAPRRVRSLALLSPVPPDGLALPSEVAAGFRSAGGSREALAGILDAACKRLSARARGALSASAASIAPDAIAATFDAWSRGGVPAEALAAIACPTLVVASDDPFLPPDLVERAVVRRIPGARMTTLRGSGHYLQVEATEATAALLEAHFEAAA